MQLASSSLTVRTDANRLRRSHNILFSSASVCTWQHWVCHVPWSVGHLGAPWGPLGLKPSRLMHTIGDDDDGDRDRDATMMVEHDGELMMAMTVALT